MIDSSDAMVDAAAQLRASGALGRSGRVSALFDYLLAATLDGQTVREVDIAIAVFKRGADFDPALDAVVRVYLHKLRQILGRQVLQTRSGPVRLVAPRGEYRLRLESASDSAAPELDSRRRRLLLTAAGGLGIAAASSAATLLVTQRKSPRESDAQALRRNPPWRALLTNGLPTLLVIGDYFLIGEAADGVNVDRLVREFDVNSTAELEALLAARPELARRYLDLDLRYIPVSSASAIGRLAPLLLGTDRRRPTEILLASELTPRMLRTNNIVYVGYFSGLQALRATVLEASRFAMGETDDEIVDLRSGRRFTGEGGEASGGRLHREYGLLACFGGPAQGRIIAICGTRDIAVRQMTEIATTVENLTAILDRVGNASGFEAFYEISGIDRQNVSGRLELATPIDDVRIWVR